MEIFFCSHCNQSIPLRDIQSGVAELRRGKYLCATCKEIVPSYDERRPNYVAMVLGIFLVGALAVIGFLIFQEDLLPAPRAPAPVEGPSRASILAGLAELESRSVTRAEVAEEAVRGQLREIERRLTLQDRALERLAGRLEELGRRPQPALDPAVVTGLDRSVTSLAADVARLQQGVGATRQAVNTLREEMTQALERAPAPAAPAEPVLSARDRWIAMLQDEAMDRRFNALAQLGDYKGEDVVKALVGRLKDREFFIRRWVAEDLGERKAVAAIPALVETLADDEVTVRTAAVEALRKITGKNFGYKSTASDRERARAMARWRSHAAEVAGRTRKK